ncbi:MAG: tetratricopeptide repeat protein [Reichenbachiella sp.]
MISGEEYYFQLIKTANEAHQSGDLKKAKSLYVQLTKDMPDQSEPFHMLGLMESQQGNFDAGFRYFERAIERQPKNPIYRNNFAEALFRTGNVQPAIDQLSHALKNNPKFYQAKFKLATIFNKVLEFSKAKKLLLEIIQQKPEFEPAHSHLGAIDLELGKYNDAKSSFATALKLTPDSPDILNNLGVICQKCEEFDQAIDFYQKALQNNAVHNESIRNLALVYETLGDVEKSKRFYRQLSSLKNDDPVLLWKSETISPIIFNSTDEILQYRRKLTDQIEWIQNQKINLDLEQLLEYGLHPPVTTTYHGIDELPLRKGYAAVFKGMPKAKRSKQKNGIPKIGFVVTAGHEGVFLKSMKGIIDRFSEQKMETWVVASSVGIPIIASAINNEAVQYLALSSSLGRAAHQLTNQNFDLLYYWEVGTDGMNYFLPYLQPARIQCTGWGWPITSGHDRINYFISTKGLDEDESQKQYSEKLVLFDKLPSFYFKPLTPSERTPKTTFGFSEKSNIYLCLQNIKKIHPDFDIIIAKILAEDEQAQVVFISDKKTLLAALLKKRLKEVLKNNIEKVHFLPWMHPDRYYQLISMADVVLDTPRYGGANTAYDAFSCNTPVITISGIFFRSRFTAQAYRQMGIDDLIAKNDIEYVYLATKIATDASYRAKVVSKIDVNNYKIFEDQEAVSELEAFILKVCNPQ